jgi:hypothetical protein
VPGRLIALDDRRGILYSRSGDRIYEESERTGRQMGEIRLSVCRSPYSLQPLGPLLDVTVVARQQRIVVTRVGVGSRPSIGVGVPSSNPLHGATCILNGRTGHLVSLTTEPHHYTDRVVGVSAPAGAVLTITYRDGTLMTNPSEGKLVVRSLRSGKTLSSEEAALARPAADAGGGGLYVLTYHSPGSGRLDQELQVLAGPSWRLRPLIETRSIGPFAWMKVEDAGHLFLGSGDRVALFRVR